MDPNQYTAEATPSVSKHILDIVKSGGIWLRLQYDEADACKVQFAKASTRLYYKDFYFTMLLTKTVPRGVRLLFLFPETRVVLDTSKTRDLATINAVIDKNLGKDPKTTQAVLCVGDALYKVEGVTGRLYMQWAQKLEYVSGRNPNRWSDTPVLASTDRHFKTTGMFPVFGQNKLTSFIGQDCFTLYVPAKYIVWSLDTAKPVSSIEHEALMSATVSDRLQRDMIPDHEVHKYQRRVIATSLDPQDSPRSDESGQEDRSRRRLDQSTTATTGSEDYDSVTLLVSDLPTPRPFARTEAAASVLASGFFALDEPGPDDHTPSPIRQTSQYDLSYRDTPKDEEIASMIDSLNIPLVPLFSPPNDSLARRTAASRSQKTDGSAE